MKISRNFVLSDLVMTCDVSLQNAYGFVEKLAKAGYIKVLHRMGKHLPLKDRTPSRYQLIRDTGRFAPVNRIDGCWDQNEQRLYAYEHNHKGDRHVA